MFRDREDAGRRLAARFQERPLRNPLVLGIPRGGVALGAVLARAIGADLDVVLARKLRSPQNPEYAIGALSEGGEVFLNPDVRNLIDPANPHLVEECRRQKAEIARRKELFRAVHPQAPVSGRSVIVTDDGIATGSTMIAGLRAVRHQASPPYELIVAVPVASEERLAEVRRFCDEVVCLLVPEHFWAIGEFYQDFHQLEDEEVSALLRRARADNQRNAGNLSARP